MGGHNHEFNEAMKVPDWRIYKIEDTPELKAVQQALAKQGLRDPWLRNHVWKYIGEARYNHMPTIRIFRILRRGFKYGLAAAIITASIEKVLLAKFGNHGDSHH